MAAVMPPATITDEMERLRTELAAQSTANRELADQLSQVRLENRAMQKSMRNSAAEVTLEGDAGSDVSQGVTDLRVLAMRRKRDAMNLQETNNLQERSSSGIPCRTCT